KHSAPRSDPIIPRGTDLLFPEIFAPEHSNALSYGKASGRGPDLQAGSQVSSLELVSEERLLCQHGGLRTDTMEARRPGVTARGRGGSLHP
ncbi:hypothetical protein KUCAC02_036603, partial [Chaenocephalus aceratus]